MNGKYFCVNPFIGFEIKTDGYVSPCCKYQSQTINQDNYITNNTLNTIRNSGEFKILKEDILHNRPNAGCKFCYYDETNNIESKRQRDNFTFSNHISEIEQQSESTVRSVDLKLGNVCNLKCVICSETSSSKWYEEKLRWDGDKIEKIPDYNKKFKWHTNKEFWNELYESIGTIQEISIFGGEPFLIKEQFSFIDALIESGHSKHINLSYSTNGTILPMSKLKNIDENFNMLNIMISADGIKDTFEYNRFPAKWEDVEKNIHKFKTLKKANIGISYSVSLFSVFNLAESLNFYRSINQYVWLNMVHDHSSIKNLPNDLKKLAIEQLKSIPYNDRKILLDDSIDGIIEYINTPPSVDFSKTLVQIKNSDKYRNVSICDIIPGMLKYYE